MRAIVLPEVPAIRGHHPEEPEEETSEDIPGAPGLVSRAA
jgi:hypothetical protein